MAHAIIALASPEHEHRRRATKGEEKKVVNMPHCSALRSHYLLESKSRQMFGVDQSDDSN